MGAARWAILVGLVALAAPPAAAETLLFLRAPAQTEAEVSAVLEQVAIYTRDLGVAISVRSEAPPATVTGGAIAATAALARAAGARLVFWYAPRIGEAGTVLYTVGGDGVRDTHALIVAGAADLPRVLALKLRAVVTGAVHAEPSVPLPPPASPPAASVTASTPAAAAAATAPVAALAAAAAPAAAPARRGVRVATGYWLTVPAGGALTRQGLAVEVAAQPRPALEVHLGLDFTTKPAVTGAGGVATLFDLPVRLGARLLLRRGGWTFGLGPLASLHVLSATGLALDGVAGGATRATAGLGAAVLARRDVSERTTVEVRVLFERTVPHTRFLLHGTPAIDDGTWLLGLGAAVGFVAP
jgi:hypothetical protein